MSAIVHLDGRLGCDLVRNDANNVVSFSIAVDLWKGGKKSVIWFDCSVWGGILENKLKYMRKGKRIHAVCEISSIFSYVNKSEEAMSKVYVNVLHISFPEQSVKKNGDASDNADEVQDSDKELPNIYEEAPF